MRKLLSLIIIVVLLFFSCGKTNQLEKDIETIPVEVVIERFDQLFANTTIETLPKLKAEFPFMFSKRDHDSIVINKINNTFVKQLSIATKEKFNDLNVIESEIESLFKHLKYYNKSFKTPRIIGLTDHVDYRNKVFATDSIVLLGLDTYLGENHELYKGIYQYIAQNLKPSQMVPDLAFAYAKQKIYQPKRSTFLEEMIYYGKIYYFMDVMIPFKTDEEKIGYTPEQLAWARVNEINMWTYFVENEVFYKRDPKLVVKFINPAPFSRFNLELDRESPARTGCYIGWQIVRSYMKNNKVSLDKLLNTSVEEIFNNAKFKPRK